MSDSNKSPPADQSSEWARHGSAEPPFSQRENFPSLDEVWTGGEVDQSSSSHTSSANLSIGARAALNEHLRHVAKFGLDDSHHTPPRQAPRNSLDRLWESLVDGSGNDISHISSASVHTLQDAVRFERVVASGWEEGEQAIEVLADQSDEYFNTSKVMLLRTPEKNRSRRIEAVTSRREATNTDESFSMTSGYSGYSGPMMGMFQHPEVNRMVPADPPGLWSHEAHDQSFGSLAAVDLSRISADGSENHMKRSPENSFVQDHRRTIGDVPDFFTPIESSRREARPLVTPGRVPPRMEMRKPPPPNHMDRQTDENVQNFGSPALSPIAGSAQGRRALGSLPVWPQHDEPPQDMMVEVDNVREPDSDMSTLQNSSSEKKNSSSEKKNSSPSSSQESSWLQQDRRRFRTVVPARVFLKEGVDMIEPYDSFSNPLPHRTMPIPVQARSIRSHPF